MAEEIYLGPGQRRMVIGQDIEHPEPISDECPLELKGLERTDLLATFTVETLEWFEAQVSEEPNDRSPRQWDSYNLYGWSVYVVRADNGSQYLQFADVNGHFTDHTYPLNMESELDILMDEVVAFAELVIAEKMHERLQAEGKAPVEVVDE